MNWYKTSQELIKKPPMISVCSNCGLVYRDPSDVVKGKKYLTVNEQNQIENSQKGRISHGICRDCCVELYGEELCQNLTDEDYQ